MVCFLLVTSCFGLMLFIKQCCDEASLDFGPVSDCSTSSTGNKLEHQMGLLTEALDPPHKYTPWITLNGVSGDRLILQCLLVAFRRVPQFSL